MSNKPAEVLTTDEEIDTALEQARLMPEWPRAVSAEYNRQLDLVIVKIDNGQRLRISHGRSWTSIITCPTFSKANTPPRNGRRPMKNKAPRRKA